MQQIIAMVKHWDGDLCPVFPAGVNISVHDCVPLSPNDWVICGAALRKAFAVKHNLCTPATALDLFQLAI